MNEKTSSYTEFLRKDYQYGFSTNVKSVKPQKGLNNQVIQYISHKKSEPEWMLKKRLSAYQIWKVMKTPHWGNVHHPEINFQDIYYYSEPKRKKLSSLKEVDPDILKTYQKLGIPIHEQKILSGVAVDAVFDSVSVATTYKSALKEKGIIFCSMSEAIQEYPHLIKKYFGRVVSNADNYFAALNTAVFSDGTFVYIPKNTKCPIELSTYFRINEPKTGQFERTLIIADEGSEVSYLEGCTAPQRDENQLHAAVVELIAFKEAVIKYSTVQNWYPGDKDGKGGIYNFVTKRGLCEGEGSKISWTQLETGSAITWKYPSCILKGNNSIGEFYSVALTNNHQQADTGTKMIHIGKNTRSLVISKGISAAKSSNTYRGLVKILPSAIGAKNFTQCDSLLIGRHCVATTIPYIETKNNLSDVEHEATTSKVNEDQLQYCLLRGISVESAISLIVSGFCRSVLNKLPMEFALEARALLNLNLEGAIG